MHKSNRWTDKSRNSILSLFCIVIMEAFHFLNSTFCLSHFPEEISHECFLVNIHIETSLGCGPLLKCQRNKIYPTVWQKLPLSGAYSGANLINADSLFCQDTVCVTYVALWHVSTISLFDLLQLLLYRSSSGF